MNKSLFLLVGALLIMAPPIRADGDSVQAVQTKGSVGFYQPKTSPSSTVQKEPEGGATTQKYAKQTDIKISQITGNTLLPKTGSSSHLATIIGISFLLISSTLYLKNKKFIKVAKK
ncbi:LPXTG cell wall anchor domain-containing protein [Lactococcus nasutitermitis]|uniref:LPXTG cell wall anchor domain-containing protein n=1 Tax=Lactococcus nasutitermitis TaxID=1652957 RepID=A0ABV9JET8_9LACT|nr:LPXTG cell wall anchor domain-containing protein [Lactococcus nasutitermitis]